MNAVQAGCKVNLGLRVTGLLADGYHEIDSLFYPLEHPCDHLLITPAAGQGIAVHCNAPDIDPKNNTLTKAYMAFVNATGSAPGIDVVLRKGIPSGAGLGGGSSDAAALLLWLNRTGQRGDAVLDQDALAGAALAVGTDTPFFLQKSPCRVRGIGETLTPVADIFAGFRLVLACPALHVSTAWAYAAFDAMGLPRGAESDLTIQSHRVSKNTCSDISGNNDLEAVVFQRYPLLARFKAQFLRQGALIACMSGSGSAVAGLFGPEDDHLAKTAAIALRKRGLRVFLLRL
ncbi:MAG: 4-(cytidine 5'-diphospho)-2-C-methyl-D-erythritol kinase [Desulfovibrio sp.]|jgi:4-diphosphocytidyl-2-C-methyl-D-erythritol kinase|nr:4-(cytidine 5'-diphospho)-2-C-methyl-D-erythritol kinase [Desulfovibrio sp.]